jgi:predicted dehydrogenase
MAVFDDLTPDSHLTFYDRGVETSGESVHGRPHVAYRLGTTSQPYIAGGEPLALEDQHFLECIRTGVAPRTPSRDGLSVVCALEAAAESLTTGLPTNVIAPDPALTSVDGSLPRTKRLVAHETGANGW